MAYVDTLPSKAKIFDYWKDRFRQLGIFIDWGEPSCWACHFHYDSKYDIRSSDASWLEILDGWERMPLQRCHIVPRSLGGSDEPSNLFLMCRECHDLAPNTSIPELFFEWVRAQSFWRRESSRIDEALRAFGVQSDECEKLLQLFDSECFREWANAKIGLHWPQCRYAARSFRLTPATMVGLAMHYLRHIQKKEYIALDA